MTSPYRLGWVTDYQEPQRPSGLPTDYESQLRDNYGLSSPQDQQALDDFIRMRQRLFLDAMALAGQYGVGGGGVGLGLAQQPIGRQAQREAYGAQVDEALRQNAQRGFEPSQAGSIGVDDNLLGQAKFWDIKDAEHIPAPILQKIVEARRAGAERPKEMDATGLIMSNAGSAAQMGQAILGGLKAIPFAGQWFRQLGATKAATQWLSMIDEAARVAVPQDKVADYEKLGKTSYVIGSFYPATAAWHAAGLAGRLPVIAQYASRIGPIAKLAIQGGATGALQSGGLPLLPEDQDQDGTVAGSITSFLHSKVGAVTAGGVLGAGLPWLASRVRKFFPSVLDKPDMGDMRPYARQETVEGEYTIDDDLRGLSGGTGGQGAPSPAVPPRAPVTARIAPSYQSTPTGPDYVVETQSRMGGTGQAGPGPTVPAMESMVGEPSPIVDPRRLLGPGVSEPNVAPMEDATAVATGSQLTKQATIIESPALPNIGQQINMTDGDVAIAATHSNPGEINVVHSVVPQHVVEGMNAVGHNVEFATPPEAQPLSRYRFDSVRTASGRRRPIAKVSNDGLIDEMMMLEERAGQQNTSPTVRVQDDASRTITVGSNVQGRAIQRLRDDSRMMQEIAGELRNRGLTDEDINNLRENRLNLLAEREGFEMDAEPIDPAEPFSLLRTGPGTVGAGFDKSLFNKLGANLYKGDLGLTAVKEGLQNAFDAIRMSPTGGDVAVDVENQGRRLIFTDTGIGMSPDVAANALMDIGGSGKESGGAASGGYGLAKVALFSGADNIFVETISPTAPGQFVKTTIKGSGKDWVEGTLKFQTMPMSGREIKPGTRMEIDLGAHAKADQYDLEEFIKRVHSFNRSGINVKARVGLPSPVDPTHIYYRDVLDPAKMGAGVDVSKDFLKLSVPGADMEFFYGTRPTSFYAPEYKDVHVLNRGLYQFTLQNLHVPGPGLPQEFVLDVHPTVDVENPQYPFTTSREELKAEAKKELEKTLEKLGQMGSQEEIMQLMRGLVDAPEIPWTPYKVVDTSNKLDRRFVESIANKPYIAELTKIADRAMQTIFKTIRDRYPVLSMKAPEFGGLGLGKGYLGINISREALASLAKNASMPEIAQKLTGQPNVILYNPYATIMEMNDIGFAHDPEEIADQTWGTLGHEVIHQIAQGHNAKFAGAMTRYLNRVNRLSGGGFFQEFRDFFKQHLSQFLDDARYIEDAIPADDKGIFGKIAGHQATLGVEGLPTGGDEQGGFGVASGSGAINRGGTGGAVAGDLSGGGDYGTGLGDTGANPPRIDALVSTGPIPRSIREQYEQYGSFSGQDATIAGGAGVRIVEPAGPDGIGLFENPFTGDRFASPMSRVMPGKASFTPKEAPRLYEGFKQFVMAEMKDDLELAGIDRPFEWTDSVVSKALPSLREDWLDTMKLTDPHERAAIAKYFDIKRVEDFRALDQVEDDAATDAILRANQAEMEASSRPRKTDYELLQEMAGSKGFTWVRDHGQFSGRLFDQLSNLVVPAKDEMAAAQFLVSFNREAPDLSPLTDVPVEAIHFPASGTPGDATDPILSHDDHVRMGLNALEDLEEQAQAAESSMTTGGGGFQGPPSDPPPAGRQFGGQNALPEGRFGPVQGPRLPTMADQFRHANRYDLGAIMEEHFKLSRRLLVPMRYAMQRLETDLRRVGVDLARPWQTFDELSLAADQMHNWMRPWFDRIKGALGPFPRRMLRDGTVAVVRESFNKEQMYRQVGYSERLKKADQAISDLYRDLFRETGLGDERELMNYVSHVRAQQELGVPDPFVPGRNLSPHTEFFARYARTGNLNFRQMDMRVLLTHYVRALGWEKYLAAPWENAKAAWSNPIMSKVDSRQVVIPPKLEEYMQDWLDTVRTGYQPYRDYLRDGVQHVAGFMGVPITRQEANGFIGAVGTAGYRGALGFLFPPLFRDAIQPWLAGTKVGFMPINRAYTRFFAGGAAQMRQEAIDAGAVILDMPRIEDLGTFETFPMSESGQPAFDPKQLEQREVWAKVGDAIWSLTPERYRFGIQATRLDPLHWYTILNENNRIISFHAGRDVARSAISQYFQDVQNRPDAMDRLMSRSKMVTYDPSVQRQFEDQIKSGDFDGAADFAGRTLADESQFRGGLRERPELVRKAGTFGRIGMMFGNFSEWYANYMWNNLANGGATDKMGFLLRHGVVLGALAYAQAKTGWPLMKWAWHTSLYNVFQVPATETLAVAQSVGSLAQVATDPTGTQQQDVDRVSGLAKAFDPNPLTSIYNPLRGAIKTGADLGWALNMPSEARNQALTSSMIFGQRSIPAQQTIFGQPSIYPPVAGVPGNNVNVPKMAPIDTNQPPTAMEIEGALVGQARDVARFSGDELEMIQNMRAMPQQTRYEAFSAFWRHKRQSYGPGPSGSTHPGSGAY